MRRGQCITCRKTKINLLKRELVVEVFLILCEQSLFRNALPGHNFTCPGIKLYKRLNSDGTPKEWGMPRNRVDNAAYDHDLCYFKHDDTKTRNKVCDKTMLNELNEIVKPTLRERTDKSIVEKLMKAKVNFGLGAPVNIKTTAKIY